MKTIIITDDKQLTYNFSELLLSHVAGLRILLLAETPAAACDYLKNKEKERPDLIFAGIARPGNSNSNLSLLEELQVPLPVIWLGKAPEGDWPVKLLAVDVLTDPYSVSRLERALERFKTFLEYVLVLKKQMDDTREITGDRKFLLVKNRKEYRKIRLDDITRITCKTGCVSVHTFSGEKFTGFSNLTKLEALLPAGWYFRVSRNCLVPVSQFSRYKIEQNGKVKAWLKHPAGNEQEFTVTISRERVPAFRNLFDCRTFG